MSLKLLRFLFVLFVVGPAVSGAVEGQLRYYPHWAQRNGALDSIVLNKLPAGTAIGVHHTMDIELLKRILEHRNNYKLVWYAESNIDESEDPATGQPIENRISEAARKRDLLKRSFSLRAGSEIELDAAQDLFENGERTKVVGHAKFAQKNGFSYKAKNMAPEAIQELKRNGVSVTSIVVEDAVHNSDYRNYAAHFAHSGLPTTLVVHYQGYAGDPGASEAQVLALKRLRAFRKSNVEIIYGFPEKFEIIKYTNLD